MVQSMFNPNSKEESSIISEVKPGLIFPYLQDYRLQIDVEVEMGIAEKDLDRIGIQAMLGLKLREIFYLIGDIQKTYFPRQQSDALVSFSMLLTTQAHLYAFSTYRITDWLIAMGGISKALYFGGLLVANFVAKRMYRAALMQDIFLVQEQQNHQEDLTHVQHKK